jgi:hypothetical protein
MYETGWGNRTSYDESKALFSKSVMFLKGVALRYRTLAFRGGCGEPPCALHR